MPPKAAPPAPEPVLPPPVQPPVEAESLQTTSKPSEGVHVLHSNGSVALHFGVKEDGFAYYANGKIAVMVQHMGAGHYTYFYGVEDNDRKQGSVIASFDPLGVGQVYYPNGKNRLTVNMSTMWMYDENGDIQRIIEWDLKKKKEKKALESGVSPEQAVEVIQFALNTNLALRIVNRQDMAVEYTCGNVSMTVPCGERLLRSTTYLDKTTHQHKWGEFRGKFEVDLSKTTAQRWHSPAKQTKPKIHLIPDNPELRQLMSKVDSISIDDKGGKFNTTSFITKAEMGSAPPPIPTKRRAVEQKPKRIKLEEVQPKLYDKFVEGVRADQLLVVCCLSSWSPAATKVEPTLEEVNATVLNDTSAENKPYRLVRFDMSSNLLKDRHHIRTVPMFLMYYGGRLVYANNTFNGLGTRHDDVMAQMALSVEAARKGAFLPDKYQFPVVDTNLMDGVFKRLDNVFAIVK